MATVTWIGKASTVRESRPYTAAGTTTGVYAFTINGKRVAITGDGGTAATQAATLTAALIACVEPEFKEITWAVSGAVITATGPTDGAPITLADSSTGSATLTAGSVVTGTSPNHLAAANFDTGALPANSDTVVFPPQSADIKYGLTAMSAITGLTIWRQAGGPKIGLQDWKAIGYREYRALRLVVPATTLKVDLGQLTDFKAIRFLLSNTACAISVTGTRSGTAGAETLEVADPTTASTLNANGGSVSVIKTTGTVAIATLNAANGVASIGAGVTLGAATFINAGGYIDNNFTTLGLNGGTVAVRLAATGTPTVDAGVLDWQGTGQITNLVLGSGGVLNTTNGVGAITVSGHIDKNEGGVINDPTKRLTHPWAYKCTRNGIGGVNAGEHVLVTVDDYS